MSLRAESWESPGQVRVVVVEEAQTLVVEVAQVETVVTESYLTEACLVLSTYSVCGSETAWGDTKYNDEDKVPHVQTKN